MTPDVGSRWRSIHGRVATVTRVETSEHGVTVYMSPEDRPAEEILCREEHFDRLWPTCLAPTKPASRWLDPTSVPIGPPIRVCSKHCPFPSRNSSGFGALCAYCATQGYYVCPSLPPSVLTPVPRWRSLAKERLYPSTPRVRVRLLPNDYILPLCEFGYEVAAAKYIQPNERSGTAPRVRKVIARAHGQELAGAASWAIL